MFTRESLTLSLVAFPAALLGMKIGAMLDRRISNYLSRQFIIYVFIAGGISTTIYAIIGLLA